MQLLQEIYDRAGSRAGCFDVFCWKDDYSLVFAESERKLVASSVILYSQLAE
jgi:hypothetical protein